MSRETEALYLVDLTREPVTFVPGKDKIGKGGEERVLSAGFIILPCSSATRLRSGAPGS